MSVKYCKTYRLARDYTFHRRAQVSQSTVDVADPDSETVYARESL